MQYEYKCDACGEVFERILKMSDSDVPKSEPCPNCGEVGQIDRHYSTVPGLNYSAENSYAKGDSTFQKYVLDPIMKGVPSHMRAESKFKTPREF